MSDFFNEEPDAPRRPMPVRHESRRPRPLVLTLVVMAVLLIGFSLFAGIWTDRLWFHSIGYGAVFSTLLWTKIGMFVLFGALMGLIVGGNLWIAYRLRPMFRASSAEQANLDRYREVITPIRRVLVISVSVVFALFAGGSASGKWRTFLMWEHRQSFGKTDAYFHKDIGFYVFTLPWLHFLVDFMITALVIGLLAALVVHYVYGGIRLQARVGKVSGPAQAQISVLLGVLVLLKAADYYLDRFDLTSQGGPLITGMTYSRDHAMLPSKNILMAIAVICALLFFANVFRRTWMLPAVGLALFAMSAVLLGMAWPAVVQQFQVKPSEPDKEAPYIRNNIKATRAAYDLDGTSVTEYDAKSTLSPQQLNADAGSLPGIRLIDPTLVSETFQQLQQQKGYYSVPAVLDVDRYQIQGRERDLVVAARELHQDGLADAQKNWANLHTVYTHGYGMIAAYGNQRDENEQPITGREAQSGQPAWAEEDLPPTGQLTDLFPDGYRGQIYFGEQSPEYSIVGKAPGGSDVELDLPQGKGTGGASTTTTYSGKDGVGVGSLFRKALYAVKFGDSKIVLSSRVNENSKILYNRSPRERVQKVAPWLTVDNDALPSVVDGRIVWILDGYTTTDRYPLSEKKSFQEMTSDAINPRTAYATLPTDQINYIRNAVKATVDAYDGTVTLYAWDDSDPILKAWEGVFPGVVKPRADIPEDLLAHFRYPEDMFKAQRSLLAAYHVTDPKTFYEGNDKWDTPEDPNVPTRKQPPYRLSVATASGGQPVFSLTSVYVPFNKQNLASFISVGADASDPSTYGKFRILRLPDTTQISGPSQIANQFNSDDSVANALLPFKRAGTKVTFGNLLTLPVGNGLLYVQPVYTLREEGSGNYPALRFVLASFGNDVGVGPTLSGALDDVLGTTSGSVPQTPTGNPGGGTGEQLPTEALRLLQQADAKFREADAALKSGDLQGYAKAVEEGRQLVERALASGKQTSGTTPGATPSKAPSGSPSASPSASPGQ